MPCMVVWSGVLIRHTFYHFSSVFLAPTQMPMNYCEANLFPYDLACSNWRERGLVEWYAFSLDVTAEYEYENLKRAVESAWVVIFMRIRHNVFRSRHNCLLCQWTVRYVWAVSMYCIDYVSLVLHIEHMRLFSYKWLWYLHRQKGISLYVHWEGALTQNTDCGGIHACVRA